ILTKLPGVGPATAALLLSVRDPDRVPFFADEVFWWVCCGGEWGKKIGYTVKEFAQVVEGVREVSKRLQGRSAMEVEKVAWTVGIVGRGKLNIDLNLGDGRVERGTKKSPKAATARKDERKRKKVEDAYTVEVKEGATTIKDKKRKVAANGQGSKQVQRKAP